MGTPFNNRELNIEWKRRNGEANHEKRKRRMSEDQNPFHERRRQVFLYEKYYEHKAQYLPKVIAEDVAFALADNDLENNARLLEIASSNEFFIFSLRYTAGESLDQLRTDFTQVVEAYERYAKYDREYRQEPRTPLFDFKHIDDYVRLIQLVSLAILLRREDLILRIHDFVADSAFDGEDALYEELVTRYLPNRPYIDEWYHDLPYRYLLDATAGESQEERLTDLNRYLKAWYPNMKGCGWYNAHEHMSDEGGGYFGYWAFEAGAVAFLLDIDDSSIDHMVYPKALVAYARKLRDEGVKSPHPDHGRLRGLPNEIVPKTGWWWSPAFTGTDALRHFNQGEHFPSPETTNYGGVFWYFDADRQPKE